MASTENNKVYKKLDMNIELPPELENDIDNYVNYLNQSPDHLSEDCLQMEILTSLNWCIREEALDVTIIQKLKDYYIKGGIHKGV